MGGKKKETVNKLLQKVCHNERNIASKIIHGCSPCNLTRPTNKPFQWTTSEQQTEWNLTNAAVAPLLFFKDDHCKAWSSLPSFCLISTAEWNSKGKSFYPFGFWHPYSLEITGRHPSPPPQILWQRSLQITLKRCLRIFFCTITLV